MQALQVTLGNGNVLPINNQKESGEKRPGLRWEPCNAKDNIPPDAILGGWDIAPEYNLIYVGRSHHNDEVLPAKIIPTHHQIYAFVSYGGREFLKPSFEVLCGDPSAVSWAKASNGGLPQRVVVGGMTSDGEKLYIGRTKHLSSQTVGKIHPSHKRLYFPFNNVEFCTHFYEVLHITTTDS